MALTVLATYDIVEDKRRAHVAAALQQWGDRLQYSVFVCTLEPAELDKLVERTREMVDPEKDSLLFLRQCGECWGKAITIGQSSPKPSVLYWSVM